MVCQSMVEGAKQMGLAETAFSHQSYRAALTRSCGTQHADQVCRGISDRQELFGGNLVAPVFFGLVRSICVPWKIFPVNSDRSLIPTSASSCAHPSRGASVAAFFQPVRPTLPPHNWHNAAGRRTL